MKCVYRIIWGLSLCLQLMSCGQQHDAEQLVEQFIDKYAVAPEQIENRTFQHLDSTKLISDSLIGVMQQRRHELFKDDIDYPAQSAYSKLYYLGMYFTYQGDTLRRTFYIDESLEHIVAFK